MYNESENIKQQFTHAYEKRQSQSQVWQFGFDLCKYIYNDKSHAVKT